MKELIEHIGSYNIFNYLLPGIVFSVVIENYTSFNLLPEDAMIMAFVCYFIGLTISRVGSLVIQPILEKLKFTVPENYTSFIGASKKDLKIEVLSEQNNTYRTIISMLLLIGVSIFYNWLVFQYPMLNSYSTWIILVPIFILFLFAYRKQTSYISKRIKSTLK